MDAYVYDAIRTPRGRGLPPRGDKPGGALSGTKPMDLLAGLFRALEKRSGLDTALVDDVLIGCNTVTAEQGANIAKIASLYAGWSPRNGGGTVSRFCASGLEAVRLAAHEVNAHESIAVAGGVESMSRVPMFSDGGAWFADPQVAEATSFLHLGVAADVLATREGIARADLDAIAVRSHARALQAKAEGRFNRSMVPVMGCDGKIVLEHDELPREGITLEKLARFPAAFSEVDGGLHDRRARAALPELERIEHSHHVATSPGLADAASLVLIGDADAQQALGVAPRAQFLSFATYCGDPVPMIDGNVPCARKALERAGLGANDVHVFEVNESFAAVTVHFERSLGVDPDRMNPNGGALALGHPLGATGGILIGMALDELERSGQEHALVSICGGAGLTSSAVLRRVR